MNSGESLLLAGLLLQDLLGHQTAVIGGVAVGAWGTARSTEDVDLITKIPATAVVAALKEHGVSCSVIYGDLDDPLPWVIHGTVKNDITPESIAFQIIPKPRGVTLTGRIVKLPMGLQVIGFEDLITLKCAAGGPQDLVDIAKLVVANPDKRDKIFEIARGFKLDSHISGFVDALYLRDR